MQGSGLELLERAGGEVLGFGERGLGVLGQGGRGVGFEESEPFPGLAPYGLFPSHVLLEA